MRRDPLIIGGMPGSGTRLFCQLAIDAGVFMGTNITNSYDAVEFANWYNKWILAWVYRKIKPISDLARKQMQDEFDIALEKHLTQLPEEKKWGFKNPRSILLIDFFIQEFPNLKLIHVVRDGRDIAYSRAGTGSKGLIANQGSALIGKPLQTGLDRLRLWSVINMYAIVHGKQVLGDNYLCVRYEDLIKAREPTLQKMFGFIGNRQEPDVKLALSRIRDTGKTGRWLTYEKELQAIPEIDLLVLELMGYL